MKMMLFANGHITAIEADQDLKATNRERIVGK